LRGWSGPVVLTDPSFLRRADYQAYAVMTMCRAWYALERGDVISKPAAARWDCEHQPERWHALIRKAAARQPPAEIGRVDKIAAFIRATVEHVTNLAEALPL
jgi:hypothetical protein